MAKINIAFNDKNYPIDEDSLSNASAVLRSHLQTVINGSGAVINLDGVSYNVDSTKLSTATNSFVSHLGTISGSDYKVVVGGVEYGIGDDKIGETVPEFETVLYDLSNPSVKLEVEKITADATYANGTTYNNEEFILLNVYPKTNGTVSVTYGGLTKTIVDTSGAAEPAAQQVFFGTFNGVSDPVATPSSGKLTIAGDCRCFGVGLYSVANGVTAYCACINAIRDFGDVVVIPDKSFSSCSKLTNITIPNGVTHIGNYAFHGCKNLNMTSLPDSLKTIGNYAFRDCTNLTLTSLPDGVQTIGDYAFQNCTNLALTSLPIGIYVGQYAFSNCTNLAITTLMYSQRVSPYAFENCNSITNISLSGPPMGGQNIYGYAFYNCKNLSEVYIGGKSGTILPNAFKGCDNLTSARFESSSIGINTETRPGPNAVMLNPAENLQTNAEWLTNTYVSRYWILM